MLGRLVLTRLMLARLMLARGLLLSSLLAAPGCFLSRTTANEPISPALVARLEPGRTTAGEAASLFGAPAEVIQLGRRSAYRYDHTLTKRAGLALIVVGLFGSDTHADRVWLFFDEKDVLTHVGATLRAEDAEYALPWERLEH